MKHGVKVHKMSWINNFKIALVQKDIEKITTLINNIHELESLEDKQKGSALIQQAISTFSQEREIARHKMSQMQKSKKFLQSSHIQQATRFNKTY